jgi:hypothetical protein
MQELVDALEAGGLSKQQVTRLHLDLLERRLQRVREHLEAAQLESGMSDAEFYSSGIWHRAR